MGETAKMMKKNNRCMWSSLCGNILSNNLAGLIEKNLSFLFPFPSWKRNMRRTGAGLALKKENIGVLKAFEGISAIQFLALRDAGRGI